MEVSKKLRRVHIDPADILSAAVTIPANNANTCCLNQNWILPATFLEWSRRGLSGADDYGLTNAIAYAKRAVGCRIDRLIRNHHLSRLHRFTFPRKIEALEKIGIRIPSVIQELIIVPRNELEHDYGSPDANIARHALDIATLFLELTAAEDSRESIIALNMNILYSHTWHGSESKVTFKGWSKHSMLFIDVFEEPHTAKIVDGENGRVRYADLSAFTIQQAEQLAEILRSHFALPSRGSSGTGRYFFTEIKRQAGF